MFLQELVLILKDPSVHSKVKMGCTRMIKKGVLKGDMADGVIFGLNPVPGGQYPLSSAEADRFGSGGLPDQRLL